mmetsp:Transcript_37929/g.57196  ORF Transcript_37929/g.57196 Transcript_37929/m.57196 type:complete len:333 (+) Transcript_37929:75-1073(+)
MVMEDAPSIEFSLSREGEDDLAQQFVLKLGAAAPVRIGRAPGNDIAVANNRAISQYHCELWLKQLDGSATPQLCARDLSTNGTGLQLPGSLDAVNLVKQVDTVVPDGSTLVVPVMLKADQTDSDRKKFKVTISRAPEAADSKVQVREESEEEKDEEPNGKADDDDEEAANDEDEDNKEDDQGAREQFANLLQDEPGVSGETTYEEAREMLGDKPAWNAVADDVRRECFETFVSFLKSVEEKSNKKRKKKKSKKDKKDKDDDDDKEKKKKSKKDKEDKDDNDGEDNSEDKDDSPGKKRSKRGHHDSKDHRKGRRNHRSSSEGGDRHRHKRSRH